MPHHDIPELTVRYTVPSDFVSRLTPRLDHDDKFVSSLSKEKLSVITQPRNAELTFENKKQSSSVFDQLHLDVVLGGCSPFLEDHKRGTWLVLALNRTCHIVHTWTYSFSNENKLVWRRTN